MENAIPDLHGPEEAPANGEAPERLVIFLHGLGANGQDLIGLASIFGQVFPDAHFLAPDAPNDCDLAPTGKQWFSLQDPNEENLWEGVTSVAPALDRYIDQQLERFNLPPEKLAIVGFSQGTMLALHVAPRREKQIAAVLGFSGLLVGHTRLAQDVKTKPPIHLVHGTEDPVVPSEMTPASASVLQDNGFEADITMCEGLGHSIDEVGVKSGVVFLHECFQAVDGVAPISMPESPPPAS